MLKCFVPPTLMYARPFSITQRPLDVWDLQTVREKLKNAIRKGKAIDAERADLQRQLTALKDDRQAAQRAPSSPAVVDAVATAEQRFADHLQRLASQHREERDQLQLQVEAVSRQVDEEQAANAALQVSQG